MLIRSQQWFLRRKQLSDCVIADKFKDPVGREEDCPCDHEDYEWSVNFHLRDSQLLMILSQRLQLCSGRRRVYPRRTRIDPFRLLSTRRRQVQRFFGLSIDSWKYLRRSSWDQEGRCGREGLQGGYCDAWTRLSSNGEPSVQRDSSFADFDFDLVQLSWNGARSSLLQRISRMSY